MRATTKRVSEVPFFPVSIFLRAKSMGIGVPVILGEEEEDDEDEEWTSPQDGYAGGSEPSLMLTLVLQRTRYP